ncbi:MAG: proprotein convertase P-domain-containing protein [Flavobacteriales bacterium]|nr:proprotein convertase P-domain-containing protein [Flavobacteriales bacterium]
MRTHYSFKDALKSCCLLALVALVSAVPALAQTTFGPFSAAPALTITDNVYNGTLGSMNSSAIPVSGVTGTSVINIEVDVNINHTWPGDLVLKLVSPDGDILTLVSRPGATETADDGISAGGVGTSADWLGSTVTFTDLGAADAESLTTPFTGTYFPNPGASTHPTQTFASLFGGTMNGNWTLYAGDRAAGDVGTLNSWAIRISTVSPSILVSKFVAVEDGNGDCSDDLLPATNVINVAPGTDVCYFYVGENTGDVTLNIHDATDDILGSLLNAFSFALAPTAGAFFAVGPVTINSTVTNVATWTAYNAGPTDVATGQASATVNVGPDNDLCSGAVPLTCGVAVTGTTVGASSADNPTGCTVFSDDLGVWYSFAGTGNPVTLSTCGSTSEASGVAPWIAVFEGSCGAVSCVASGSTLTCGTNGYETAEIPTVVGTTYYVYIMANSGFPATMDFDLTLTCLPPANDNCADAIALSCGDVAAGSTLTATLDGPAGDCVNPANSNAADVWYTVSGTGYGITASLCGSGYDTKIAVFTGDCGALVCVGGNDDVCGLQSELTWTSTLGETYRIRVHGFGGATGAYNLAITCAPDCNGEAGGTAFIDGCGVCAGGSTGITPGNPVTIDMTDSWGDGWNGNTYAIYDNTDPQNPVLVVSGDLDNAQTGDQVSAGSDALCLPDGCYYITVDGGSFQNEVGWSLTGVDASPISGGAPVTVNFTINTAVCTILGCTDPASINYNPAATDDDGSCLYAPANDLCSGAIAVACGDVVSGTTVNATATDIPVGPASISEGVWYSFVGTGGDITVSTCGTASFDTEISVSQGSCGALTWVGGNDDFTDCAGLTSQYTFSSVLGTNYYIYVADWSSSLVNSNAGTFDLSITCVNPDCNGDLGGTAFYDDCNTCVGGNTGLTACVQDCNGEWGGTAVLDNCNVCVGGSTGIGPCAQDCNNEWGGTAFFDNCNVCIGGSTGLVACVLDCNNEWGGSAVLDNCNVCTGGNTGVDACTQDCNNEWGGTAFIDECGDCVGGSTGLDACDPVSVAEGGLDRSLSVYPNPNNGQFIVELNGAEGVGTLNIMDMMGRTVYTAGVNFNGSFRQSIDLNVAKGTYVLQVVTENGIATRKVELH